MDDLMVLGTLNKLKLKVAILFLFLGFAVFFIFSAKNADAAIMSLSPSSGTFEVGSTFNVNIFIDTEEETVNTISANLRFPPDALQVVSPSAGKSVIGLWITSPGFNNARGVLELTGGIPGGLNTSRGLVTTVTFRVKKPGTAFIQFLDSSDVLLHDGRGTSVLKQTQNGAYVFMLPPPAGPIVASETHPDQTKWYKNNSAVLYWTNEDDVQGYSHVLNQEPVTIPDNTSQGLNSNAIYGNLADGIYYFHIKSLREGSWGGTTHFVINIDITPPSEFPIEITPGARTTNQRPVINFSTSDTHSGINYYEIKIVPLKVRGDVDGFQKFFIETSSPFLVSELALGSYDVLVRAYDNAGNFREITQRLDITTPLFKVISNRGLEIKGALVVPWWLVFILLLLSLVISGVVAWVIYKQHKIVESNLSGQSIPTKVKEQLDELNDYRRKYGKLMVILLVALSIFLSGTSVLAREDSVDNKASAAQSEQVLVTPPIITTISKDINNDEVFYVGGQVEVSKMEILLFVQNMATGEAFSRVVESDEKGRWFYRHDSFLSAGKYLLWTQGRLDQQTSPPSPQFQITVRVTALQFGSSRISYESVFFALAFIMFLANIGLVGFIWHHRRHTKKKHAVFLKEVREAEESVRRGFAVLRRDIQAELDTIKKAKVGKELSEELKAREKELLEDLGEIEQKVGKEVWDIERTEHAE